MTNIATLAVRPLLAALEGDGGLRSYLQDAGPTGDLARNVSIVNQNIEMDLADRSPQGYPAVYVHCDRVLNALREKFRSFSGTAEIGMDVRASAEKTEEVSGLLDVCVDGVLAVLDGLRGDWGNGVFYGGGYEVSYQAVKKGGRNFVKTAKVKLTVEISRA